MKLMTILGTRPEIIRLSRVISKLDAISDHILVHTGQNYTDSLNDIFFRDLGVRKPDHYLGIQASSFGEQIGRIIAESEKLLITERPDRLLILGDTNSGLSAITAKRLGVPVYHMEAGNRCYDDRVPEEVNRRIIDHSSDILMPYTQRSMENLVREGINRERIYVTGNPIKEVLEYYGKKIGATNVLKRLKVRKDKFFLITLHRAENVDHQERLKNFLAAFDALTKKYRLPIILSLHPRTKSKMDLFGLSFDNPLIRHMTPLGFFDFVALEKNAFCVLSDSGTVQEECSIFGVPNVTIRDVTERPETIECGSNIISGSMADEIMAHVQLVVSSKPNWQPPIEYLENNVSDKIARIISSVLPPYIQSNRL
jgi:UDP-N-acetylglucosamine 2-epimerase (non-hydrolysing)